MNGAGSLLEERVADLAAARESYAAALALTPERLEPRRSLLRTLVRLGRFADAASLLVDANTAPDARDTVLLPLYESLALERGEIRGAVTALANAVDAAPGLDASSRRDLHARIATALVDHCQDMDAAEAALDRALAADPRHVATLLRRAELQRRRPDRRLVDTLTRLAVEQPDNLDFLREAAEIASSALADEALAIELLGRLCDRAGNLLARGARAAGRMAAADVAALRRRRDRAAARRVGNARAVGTGRPRCCSTAPGCGVADERRWGWLRRAAELTESAAGRPAGRDPDLAAAARAGARRRGRARGARAPLRDRRPFRRRRRAAGRRAGSQPRSGAPPRAAPRDRSSRRAARAAQQRARGPAGQPGRAARTRPDAAQAGGRPRRQEPTGGARGHPRGARPGSWRTARSRRRRRRCGRRRRASSKARSRTPAGR